MKHTLMAGIAGGLLLTAGCQSLNWTAKNKSPSGDPVAQNTAVREVPWSWRKKKSTPGVKSDLPPEIQAKFDQAKDRAGGTKSSAQWYAEGAKLEQDGKFAAATKAYESAISIDPLNADAHHRLGIMADMRQEYGTAEDHYKAALRQKPHDANTLSDFGYSHSLRGNVQQSERYLLQALDLDPLHKHATKNLGSLYASQGRYDDALQTFRRLRSEADAQQLMAQYFPKGRPIPDGDNALLASGKKAENAPASAENADPAARKDLSFQEISQLMEQRRLESMKQREQRDMAEFRPNMQPSMTQEEFARSTNGAPVSQQPKSNPVADGSRGAEWAQNPSPVDPGRGTPQSFNSANQPSANPGGFAATGNSSSSSSMPIWNGSPLASGSPRDNGASSQPAAPSSNAWPPNTGAVAQQQPPPWSNNDGAGRFPGAGSDPDGWDSQRSSATPNDSPPPWGGRSNFVAGNSAAQNARSDSLSPRQRAYQLGMSAGPGTMFPNLPADVVSNVTNHQPASTPTNLSGTQWSNSTTPGGYLESRAVDSADNTRNAFDNPNGQVAPVEVAPRSPTENWGSPSSVPWPGPSSGETTAARQPPGQMPVITPRFPASDNAGPVRGSNSPTGGDPQISNETPTGSEIVPAWFDAPPTERRGRSNAAKSVPSWPYAPKQ